MTFNILLTAAAAWNRTVTLPAVAGPNVNGISLADPGLPAAQAKYVAAGFVNAAGPPFNADPTGKSDATDALQASLDFGRGHYLTTFLPAGTYVVSRPLECIQLQKNFYTTATEPNCNNMVETFGATPKLQPHCGRTAPYVLQGTTAAPGDGRATLLVRRNAGFDGYVVKLHNPINDNINMNQVLASVDITILSGNPKAMGVYGRGAQGVSVQDVTIRAGDAAVGLDGGAGSGGSHAGVTVIGGRIGMRLSSAQPAPTLSGVVLVNQTVTALQYAAPGRETLSVAGLRVATHAGASGPAIEAACPLSVLDARIECAGGGCAEPAVKVAAGHAYLKNVFFAGFAVPVAVGDSRPIAPRPGWTRVAELTAIVSAWGPAGYRPAIYIDRTLQNRTLLVGAVSAAAPPAGLVESHTLGRLPSWEDPKVCDAKARGARGDLATDDTAALRAVLADAACGAVFLPKGYYALSATLTLRPGQALLGAGRIFSNLVPHASVRALRRDDEPAWPLLQTADGAAAAPGAAPNVVAGLSLLVWHHVNATFAVHFRGATVWRRAHTNRVDLSPGRVGPAAYYNQPLNVMSGGARGSTSRFWNFYQENWSSQGPLYRHLLVRRMEMDWRCYHCNTEHSQGEANLEVRDTTGAVAILGFKGEGNYVQIWVRNSSSFFLLGYGGNASPFPFRCPYPPGYAQFSPSIIRLEAVASVTLVNIVSQLGGNAETKCGIFDTGFAGSFYDPTVWRSVLELVPGGPNVSTAPEHWPVLYKSASV